MSATRLGSGARFTTSRGRQVRGRRCLLLHFVGDQVVLAMPWCGACSCNMANLANLEVGADRMIWARKPTE